MGMGMRVARLGVDSTVSTLSADSVWGRRENVSGRLWVEAVDDLRLNMEGTGH